ncbi:MAG TPA: hypothetical protein VJ961_06155 [Mariprofundaceae bacterium]|nr:hypothetical protein [Mariprofundaceae bacterium]
MPCRASQALKSGVLYFAIVFAAGFTFGTIRLLWLVPQVGERVAELSEMPLMFVAIVLAARWIVRRSVIQPTTSHYLAIGTIALTLLLTVEFTLILGLRGLTLGEYLAGRDPVSGAAYLIMLALFALMPLLLSLRINHRK